MAVNDCSADYYGYRKKFAVLVPTTNTAVEAEYHMMKPTGIVLATRGCVIPPFKVENETDFVNMVKAIGAATEQGLRDALTCRPDHVIFGYSAETFWDGKERSDREFRKYNDITREVAGCDITFGAQAIMDALACYPGVKRIAAITPYMPVGDGMVVKFMGDIGYEVVRIKGHCSPGPVEIAFEPFGKTRQLVREVGRRRRGSHPAGGNQSVLRGTGGATRARTRQAGAGDQCRHSLARAAQQTASRTGSPASARCWRALTRIKMRLGAVLLPSSANSEPGELAERARQLEDMGYDSLWAIQAVGRGRFLPDPLQTLAVTAAAPPTADAD